MSVARNLVPNFVAGGTITPKSILKRSTSAERTAVLCDTTSAPLGVGPRGTKYPPGTVGSNDAVAAESGDPIVVFGGGEVAWVTAGSGGVTKGAPVSSDSVGLGIIATGTTCYVVGHAVTAADAGGDFLLDLNPQAYKAPV